MWVMEALCETPLLARRVPHGLAAGGQGAGSCTGTCSQDSGRRADLPRQVAGKKRAGSSSCVLSSRFYIISRH